MSLATLTSKWQMVIPKPIRDHLGVRPGDLVDFVIQKDGKVIVRPAVLDVKQLKGALAKPGRKPVSVDQMKQIVRKRARRVA